MFRRRAWSASIASPSPRAVSSATTTTRTAREPRLIGLLLDRSDSISRLSTSESPPGDDRLAVLTPLFAALVTFPTAAVVAAAAAAAVAGFLFLPCSLLSFSVAVPFGSVLFRYVRG